MANVEVQLDVKAEYKQALAAIAMLGNALDAVQQRAKMALSVTGGAQSGANGADGAGKAEAEQKAAVEALSAAMKDAAAAAAMLTESVGKLTPALEAMGPQAEQVQQVLTLAEHYKQLAAAMGIAADAAAKYNASGAQQGETDARIQKLMEENQKLMELVSNIREEYAAIVRRNAELNRTRKEREENNKSVREEMEVTQDLTYQMQLAAMSKRELVAEIDRLIKARKEAAKAGDESKYKELTEELRLARQAMTKLRQEQQLARIAWMQQAQTAQQMGQNIRTLAEGMTGFSESVENGTVNLTGMVSAVMSMSMAIKAGLGPLGWALLAVEALSMAWNSYAKSQKDAEKAEAERKKRIDELTSSLNDAYAANEKLKNAVWVEEVADSWTSHYDKLNTALQTTVELAEKAYKTQVLQMSLQEKDDDFHYRMEGEKLKLQYLQGKITKEDMESGLDALKVEKAELKLSRAEARGKTEIERGQRKLNEAEARKLTLEEDLAPYSLYSDLYKIAPEQIAELFKIYSENQSKENDLTSKRNDVNDKITEQKKLVDSLLKRIQSGDETASFSYAAEASTLAELEEQKKEIEEEFAIINKAASSAAVGIFDQLGWLPENLEEYKEGYEEIVKSTKPIKEELTEVETRIKQARKDLEDAKDKVEGELATLRQEAYHVSETVRMDSDIRIAKKQSDLRKQEERDRLRREKEEDKIMQQYADAIEAAQWSVAKGNKSRFKGKNASAVNWLLNTALPAAADGEMTSKQLETLIKAWEQAQKTKAKTDDEMVRVIANMLNDQKISDKKTRQKITAIRKNLR